MREDTAAEGDVVLMKNQTKQNKLSTPFMPGPGTVIKKKGNSVVVETPDGIRYRRNSSHVKKIPAHPTTHEEIEDDDAEPTWATTEPLAPVAVTTTQREAAGRPQQTIRRPLRFDDYDLELGQGGY